MEWERWQQQWDAQQEAYLPDREARLAAMLDVVEAACGPAPRVLDLAGGTGSITRRLLARFPNASAVVVDVDPALLAIAAGTFDGDRRVRVCRADLATPEWLGSLGEPEASFDAVLTATALHWLDPERVAAVYAESGGLLREGGVLANADHMVDEGMGSLNDALAPLSEARSERQRADTGACDWDGWWELLGQEPEMAAVVAERHSRFAGRGGSSHTESDLASSWHIDALRATGFAHAGLTWRRGGDAVVAATRP